MDRNQLENDLAIVRQALMAQEALRGMLPDEPLNAILSALREKEALLLNQITIAEGGAAVVGEGSTALGRQAVQVMGDAGDIHTGDTYIDTQIVQAADPLERARLRYLRHLKQWCNSLPLVTLGAADEEETIGLDRLYVALDTQTPLKAEEESSHLRAMPGSSRRPDEQQRLSALEAATQTPRLALLGEPGSGKSSFVRQLAAWLAAAGLGQRERPDGWPPLIPMILALRQLAPQLDKPGLDRLSDDERQRALAAAVVAVWRAGLSLSDESLTTALEEWLVNGQVLLVLDGLDETPERLRRRVREAVRAMTQLYPLPRVIVTCRARSYGGDAVLPGFTAHTLAPLDKPKIEQFARAWYGTRPALAPDVAEARAADLARAAISPQLLELASNPMLLTTMALIHQREVGLPRERVRLYHQAVQLLLYHWQKHKGLAPSEPLAALLTDERRVRALLERLGYEAHRRQAAGAQADLARKDLWELLAGEAYLGSVALADEFLDYVDQRAGLLQGQGGLDSSTAAYNFPHRTFQEYLAGCFLVSGRGIERLYRAHLTEGDYWAVAAQLGAEELLYNRRAETDLLDLMYALCPAAEPAAAPEWRAVLWSGQMAAQVGQATVQRDAKPGGGEVYWQRVRQRLAQTLGQSPALPSRERAEAGRVLAGLGDPRPEVMTLEGMQFCLAPAGPFWMGSPDDDERAQGWEKPLHQVDIPYAYWIGRYPVTNAQFAVYVAESGQRPPDDYGAPINLPNHPVVGVSWDRALAFTRWLTQKWQAEGRLPAGWAAQLPSEAEWEKAARGGEAIPAAPRVQSWAAQRPFDRVDDLPLMPNPRQWRRYPWGRESAADGIGPNRANYATEGLGATSAAGVFPLGESPYGCHDLSGNVWEWTRTRWGPDWQKPAFNYPWRFGDGRDDPRSRDYRVMRGGGYWNDDDWLRCAFRHGDSPLIVDDHLGFRLVVSRAPAETGKV